METSEIASVTSFEEPPLEYSKEDWKDWKWQIKNSLTSNGDEKNLNLPYRITPYYLKVIQKSDNLKKTVLPSELELKSFGLKDPLCEHEHSPVKNIVHKYPDRVLFLVTDFCSTNCRYSLHEDTNILMSDFSFKKIKDICAGDEVISHKGVKKKVYETFSREYENQMLEFKTSRNLKIITTREHPFLILKKKNILCNCGSNRPCKPNSQYCKIRHNNWQHDFIPEYVFASDIEVGDYVVTPIMENNNEYKYTDTNLAYLMGVYLAEGDLPKRKNGNFCGCIRLSIGSHETDFLEKIKKVCENLKLRMTIHYKYIHSVCTIHILNTDLCKTFEQELGRLSHNKHISEDILFNSSDNFKCFLLRGMFDGDGCLWKQHDSYDLSFNTTSETLSNQIFMMLNKLGFICSIYKNNSIGRTTKVFNRATNKYNDIIHRHIIYSIRIGNNVDIQQFLEHNINSNNTGRSTSFIYNNFLFSRINKINVLPKQHQTVYDLSVEYDESFVANFFTVHNCTRSRIFNNGNSEIDTANWDDALNYIKEHTEIRDVLISGGDPLTMSDDKIEYLLKTIKQIKHVEMIRIGTKVPVVLPQRITPKLVKMLKKYHPLFMSIHFTHPDEITKECSKALKLLANAGIPLGSQTVLLKDVNDNVDVMRTLMHGLLKNRVRPYYIYSCDHVSGTKHFWTDISKGLEIIQSLRGFTTGYAVPQFIVDSSEGKIAVSPNNIIKQTDSSIILKAWNRNSVQFDY